MSFRYDVLLYQNVSEKLGYLGSLIIGPPGGDKFREKARNIFFGYTECASVQGLFYIFDRKQSNLGRIFWILVVSLMFVLGFYWCVQQYQNWKSSPVTTTISSAMPPIEMVKKKIKNIFSMCQSGDRKNVPPRLFFSSTSQTEHLQLCSPHRWCS